MRRLEAPAASTTAVEAPPSCFAFRPWAPSPNLMTGAARGAAGASAVAIAPPASVGSGLGGGRYEYAGVDAAGAAGATSGAL